jgi:outer membrane scaffolding protein for murein synthesis (MipA/OmpV family)
MKWMATGTALATVLGSAVAAEEPLWEGGAGVAVLNLPHYRGSDQRHLWVLPIPYVAYNGDIVRADRDGARAMLSRWQRLDIDLSVSAGAPARSKDDAARQGMADLPPTFELGPSVNRTLALEDNWKLDLRIPLRAVVTLESSPRGIGWTTTPNLNLDLRTAGDWRVGLQGALVYSDRRYHAHFYEVTPADATPERHTYTAHGGDSGAYFITALSRRFGQHWMGAYLRYDTLSGAVIADSPLVRQRRQWSAGFAVSWIFAASTRRVEVTP